MFFSLKSFTTGSEFFSQSPQVTTGSEFFSQSPQVTTGSDFFSQSPQSLPVAIFLAKVTSHYR